MMVFTDRERRRVAERLREAAEGDVTVTRAVMGDLGEFSGEDVALRLADMVEPEEPPCNLQTLYEAVFRRPTRRWECIDDAEVEELLDALLRLCNSPARELLARREPADGLSRGDSGDVTTMSAYDLLAKEDREALRWVREHGGLSDVRLCHNAAYNRRVELCSALGIDLETGWSDAMACMGTRLMPEGMEWPVFEDGEPVRIGSDFGYGVKLGSFEVTSILFTSEGCFLEPDYSWEADDYALKVKQGVRVKRPAPKVLDADGAEISEGDDLWHVSGYGPRTVGKVNADGSFCFEGCERTYKAEEFTHRAPVIAADGKPLREGDTVYDVEDAKGYPHTVASLELDGLGHVKTTCEEPTPASVSIHPSRLTHERPDSWDRLMDDATQHPWYYCRQHGEETDAVSPDDDLAEVVTPFEQDLVRRATALAGDA